MVASIIALTLGAGGVGAAAQLGGVVDATKDAGQATVNAGKKSGKAVTHTTKKAVGTTGSETKKSTTKTKKAVKSVRCADGTHQTAKAGCAHHGGNAK
jgi:hypothetical protein